MCFLHSIKNLIDKDEFQFLIKINAHLNNFIIFYNKIFYTHGCKYGAFHDNLTFYILKKLLLLGHLEQNL